MAIFKFTRIAHANGAITAHGRMRAPLVFIAITSLLALLAGILLMSKSGSLPKISRGDRASICNQLGAVESAGGENSDDPLKDIDDAIAALRSVLLNIGIQANDSNAVQIAEGICYK